MNTFVDIFTEKFNTLYPIEKIVISLLYGLDDNKTKSIEDIATLLKTDQKTIEQIQVNALRRLR